jgi:hypothetical protein
MSTDPLTAATSAGVSVFIIATDAPGDLIQRLDGAGVLGMTELAELTEVGAHALVLALPDIAQILRRYAAATHE